MALSDRPTLTELTSFVRRELADPSANFWTDSELQTYIADWQADLQSDFELVWGTATATAATSTLTLSTITDMLRCERIYCDGLLLSPMTTQDLEAHSHSYGTATDDPPVAYYFGASPQQVLLWPASTSTHTYVYEYPKLLSFAAATSTLQLPAWVKYSCMPYVGYRAFSRFAATQNLQRAQRYKALWLRDKIDLRAFYDAFFPDAAPRLRPAKQARLLEPWRGGLGG